MKITKIFLIFVISIFTFNSYALESCKWDNKKGMYQYFNDTFFIILVVNMFYFWDLTHKKVCRGRDSNSDA